MRILFVLLGVLLFGCTKQIKEEFTNPILSGFYPDPSICKVDEDYYLVTSTVDNAVHFDWFEYKGNDDVY